MCLEYDHIVHVHPSLRENVVYIYIYINACVSYFLSLAPLTLLSATVHTCDNKQLQSSLLLTAIIPHHLHQHIFLTFVKLYYLQAFGGSVHVSGRTAAA